MIESASMQEQEVLSQLLVLPIRLFHLQWNSDVMNGL